MSRRIWSYSADSYAFFFFSSRRRHTRFDCDWSSDVCSSDLRLPADRDCDIRHREHISDADPPADGRGSPPRSRAAKLGAHGRGRMFGIPEWAVGVAFIMLAISIGKALAGRLGPPDRQGGPRGRRDLARAVEELQKRGGGSDDVQTRLDSLEDMQRRLADVEERLDFAERMLAKQRDAERIRSEEHTSELQSQSNIVCRLM